MKKGSIRKGLVFSIIVLFIGLAIIPSTGISNIEKTNYKQSTGITLYVGGGGPGNYSSIQDAINDTQSGDTIFIYNGKYEGFIANKTLNIIGESRNDTKIISDSRIQRIRLMADWINLTTLTIIGTYVGSAKPALQTEGNDITVYNCNIFGGRTGYQGIEIGSSGYGSDFKSNIRFLDCNISNFEYIGVEMVKAYNCYIENCTFYNNSVSAIDIRFTGEHQLSYLYIKNCDFYNNHFSIELGRRKNFVDNCSFYNNYAGVYSYHICERTDNEITGCYFKNNTFGYASDPIGYGDISTRYTKIIGNVFIKNVRSIYFSQFSLENEIYHNYFINSLNSHVLDKSPYGNIWYNTALKQGNFWDDYTGEDSDGDGIGDIPYPIPIDNEDRYPLMYPTVNFPPDAPSIDGPTSIKLNTEYNFSFNTNDPNDDPVRYIIDWGDNATNLTEYGDSGEEIIIKHTWSEKGPFTIKAKAIDINDAESDWAELEVNMPRDKAIYNTLIYRILDMFPLLNLLLQRLRI